MQRTSCAPFSAKTRLAETPRTVSRSFGHLPGTRRFTSSNGCSCHPRPRACLGVCSGPKLLSCFGAVTMRHISAQRAVREQNERVDSVRDLTHGHTLVRAPARQVCSWQKCGGWQSVSPYSAACALKARTIGRSTQPLSESRALIAPHFRLKNFVARQSRKNHIEAFALRKTRSAQRCHKRQNLHLAPRSHCRCCAGRPSPGASCSRRSCPGRGHGTRSTRSAAR